MSTLPWDTRGSRAWATTWRAAVAAVLGIATFWFAYATMSEGLDETTTELVQVLFVLRVVCDIPLGIGAIVLYSMRRHAPFGMSISVILLAAVSTFAVGAALLALTSIAARRRAREIVVAVSLSIAIITVDAWTMLPARPVPTWPETASAREDAAFVTIVSALLVGLLVLVGALIGTNRGRRSAVIESALSAQRAAEAELSRAKSDERTRIAREMHDALAHRLSLVAMHAGALEYRADLSADQVRATAQIVSENSRRALEELRDILGVLRASDFTDARTAQPGAADLPALVEQASDAATVRAVLPDASVLERVPAALGLHVYRSVQEALTNHRKHAPETVLELTVTATAGTGVVIIAENELGNDSTPAVSSGHGLDGVAERMRLAGGSLSAGVIGTRFRWEAWLPWQE